MVFIRGLKNFLVAAFAMIVSVIITLVHCNCLEIDAAIQGWSEEE